MRRQEIHFFQIFLETTTKPNINVREDYLALPAFDRSLSLGFFWEKRMEIQKWCEKNQNNDQVYFVPVAAPNVEITIPTPSVVMAGSSIVSGIVSYFEAKSNLPQWQSSDIDIFHLGMEKPIRNSNLCNVDLVHVTDNTVTELLLNFDLPCCRAARDFNGNLWISAQCINAVLTGTQYLPDCLSTREKFFETGKKVMTIDMVIQRQKSRGYQVANPELTRDMMITWFGTRFFDRIEKYQARGFQTVFVKTDTIPTWLVKRFTYAEPNIGKN